MKRILLGALAALALSCAAMAQSGAYSSPLIGSGGPASSGIPYGVATGTAQAEAVTTTPNITALTTGTFATFLPVAANTAAAPTLAAGTTAATPITKCGTVALVAGDLLSTIWAVAQYDGTEWVLQNPVQAGCDGGLPTAGGSANALTLTVSPALTAYAAGQTWNLLPLAANTSAATIAISGLSTRNITKCGTTALVANDMTTTAIAVLLDDGTELQLLNPQAVPCGPAVVTSGANTGAAAMTLDMSASTTATALKPPAIAGCAPGTTAAICFDTTQQALDTGGTNLGKATLDRTFWTDNCTVDSNCSTQAATTAGTANGNQDTGSGTSGGSTLFFRGISIPANTIIANKILRACAVFQYTTSAAGPTLLMALNLGSTQIVNTTTVTPASGVTSKGWGMCAIIQGTAAAGGSVSVSGGWEMEVMNNGNNLNQVAQPVSAIATNGALILSWSALWSATTAGNNVILENQYVEVLN